MRGNSVRGRIIDMFRRHGSQVHQRGRGLSLDITASPRDRKLFPNG
jgi:hypothetical protein